MGSFWRLSAGSGLCCTADGLFLAGTALLDRREGGWAARPRPDVERLLRRAYHGAVGAEQVMRGLAVVASALTERNLCLAQIAAVHLRLPDLPDMAARRGMAAEDLLIARERAAEAFAHAVWDPDKHPRTGTPPNPGWFAPTGGADREFAGGEEEPRPEEAIEPLAALRRQLWQSGLTTLREIDPRNPQLSYVTASGWVPRQQDLDALDAAIRTAAIRRVADKLMPNSVPIGRSGKGARARELPAVFRRLQNYSITFGSEVLSIIRIPR